MSVELSMQAALDLSVGILAQVKRLEDATLKALRDADNSKTRISACRDY
jgi:hypothetical protein